MTNCYTGQPFAPVSDAIAATNKALIALGAELAALLKPLADLFCRTPLVDRTQYQRLLRALRCAAYSARVADHRARHPKRIKSRRRF